MKTFSLPAGLQLRHKNSHDIEDPLLVETLSGVLGNVTSFLDVGAHFSYHHYASMVRKTLGSERVYLASDFLPCPQTKKLVDEYVVGDFTLQNLKADFVASISVLEHCGVNSHYDPSLVEKNRAGKEVLYSTFQHLLRSSLRYFFVTFPVGLKGGHPGEYANIDRNTFDVMGSVMGQEGFHTEALGFFYNAFSQRGNPWTCISRADAFTIPYDPQVDVQAIAVWFGARGV